MTNSTGLTCQELTELITEYLEGALSAADRARFDQHLSDCRHCRAYLEQMRMTIATLGRLTPESIAPPVQDELLRRFRTWRAERGPARC
jgi:anti-sigma factor RsiW